MRKLLGIMLVILALVALAGSGAPGGRAELSAAPESRGLYLVVTRKALADALQPWVEYRRGQGFDVRVGVLDDVVVGETPREAAVVDWLAESARSAGRRPRCILLVGDVDEGQPWHVPTVRKPLYRWRMAQRRDFASDVAYGDLDGDNVPDVPVGRLPVRTEEQLQQQVEKIIRYESLRPTPNSLRIVAWTGTSAYGAASDFLAATLTDQVLGANRPMTFTAWTICAHLASPYCGYPPEQPKKFVAAMRAGSVLSVVVAHGIRTAVLSMTHEAKRVQLDIDHAQEFAGGIPVAPLVILTCDTGAFDWPRRQCLAEEFVLQPGGPIVVVAATTESHSLTNCYSAMALVSRLAGPEEGIGDWWLMVQKDASRLHNPFIQRMVLYAEGSLEPIMNVAKLRRDQMLMYNLLGDPACPRLRPEPMQVDVIRQGDELALEGDVPDGCEEMLVQLISGRGASAATQPVVGLVGKELAEAQRRNFELVNAPPLMLYRQPASGRTWRATVTLPEDAAAKKGIIQVIGLGKRRVWASAHALQQ